MENQGVRTVKTSEFENARSNVKKKYAAITEKKGI